MSSTKAGILERLVASILREMGFSTRTRAVIDGVEVDVHATRQVGASRFRIWVECKNWANEVGVKEVRDFVGGIFSAREKPHLALFVASYLSEEARREADRSGIIAIALGHRATKHNVSTVKELLRREFRKN